MSNQEPPDNGGDCIKIFVRVRPSCDNSQTCLKVNSSKEITFTAQNPKVYSFDHVADKNTTQDTVFSSVGRRIVESCVEGYNGTIFAYGQTGSGKTYTMLGPGEDNVGNFNHDLRGVIPRSLEYLFELIKKKQELHGKRFEFECSASFVEIYNERAYDLLDQCSNQALNLREDKKRGVFVDGITERTVESSHEAFGVLAEGWGNRRVASTSMNRESSRSHAVFTLTVEMKEETANGTKVRQSVLNLVDLAGSERQRDTQASGVQLREAGKINSSLSVLGQVIAALDDIAHDRKRFVPYRNSKLTFLLRDSLGGNAKTHIIVNVHPNMQFAGETTSTLQFAQRAKEIKNRARVNENMQGDVIQLQNEVRRLQAELDRYTQGTSDQAIQRTGGAYETSSFQGLEFRDKFYQAMQMLQKRDKTVSTLKAQIGKMNKANLSQNLIIKLRNSAIAALKSEKGQTKHEEVEAVQKELEHVREQIHHHPEVAVCRTKIAELQNEVKRLQQIAASSIWAEQEEELNDAFVRLVEELEPDRSFLGKSEVSADSGVISPRILEAERLKIAELEEQLRLKTEETNVLRETNSSLEAELKSSKDHVKEVENLLKSTQLDNSIHTRKLNQMHQSTIRTITTPNRGTPCAGESPAKRPRIEPIPIGNLLDISLPGDEVLQNAPNLLDQSMPQIMADIVQEALQDELNQIKEEMETIRQESLSKDSDLASLRQAAAVAEEKLSQSSQNLAELREKHAAVEKEWGELTYGKRIADLELRDLRILLKSADNEHRETKEKFERIVNSLNERISKQESSYYQLEKDKENMIVEAQKYRDECESLRSDLAAVKEMSKSYVNRLQAGKERYTAVCAELQEAKDAVERESANSASVRDQLEGKNRVVLEEMASLRNSNSQLEKAAIVAQEQMKSITSELEMKNAELEKIQKRQKELEAVDNSLRDKVSELRGQNSMLEIANSGLHTEFDELMAQFKESAEELEKVREKLKELETIRDQEKQEFRTQQEKHQFEIESLQEDILCCNDHFSAFETKLAEAETKLDIEQKKVGSLQHELEEKEKQLEEQHEILQKAKNNEWMIGERERHFDELQKKFEETMAKLENCENKLSELERDLSQARVKEKEASDHAEFLNRELLEKREENQELMSNNAVLAGHANHKQKIQYLNKVKSQMEQLEIDKQELNSRLRKALAEVRKYNPGYNPKRVSNGVDGVAVGGEPLARQDLNRR